ncbi:hypothetical protein [Haloarcula sp. H-GB5]
MERRDYLKTFAGTSSVIAFAGCSSGGQQEQEQEDTPTPRPDRDGDGVPDSMDAFPDNSNLSRVVASESDTRNIEEDEWWYYTLEFNSAGRLQYDFIVREGPAIDVIVLSESEYSSFKGEERYEYFTDVSALDSTGDEVSGFLESGTYRLIFDNSDAGEAVPPSNFSNDVVEVEFEYQLAE